VNIGVQRRIAKLALRKTDPKEVTQMVTDKKKDNRKTPGKQGPGDGAPSPNKINGSTAYDFSGKNLTPYGGLLPVITMLEKLGFQSLVEQTLTPVESVRNVPALRKLRSERTIAGPSGVGFGWRAASPAAESAYADQWRYDNGRIRARNSAVEPSVPGERSYEN
jgi:hypothetical protein